MKKLILIFFLAVFAIPAIAQDTIPEKKVPMMVKTAFKKAVRKATKVVWLKSENDFYAHYMEKGAPGTAHVTRSGEVIFKEKEISIERIHPKVQVYLENKYPKYLVYKMYSRVEGRDKYLKALVYHKRNKKTMEPITTITFTNAGRFVTVERPEKKDDDRNEEYVDEQFEEEVKEAIDDKEIAEQELTKKDLPSQAAVYLKKNFDYNWSYDLILLTELDDLGIVYYVSMKLNGNKKWIDHYFNMDGKLLKKEDRTE